MHEGVHDHHHVLHLRGAEQYQISKRISEHPLRRIDNWRFFDNLSTPHLEIFAVLFLVALLSTTEHVRVVEVVDSELQVSLVQPNN